MVQQSPLRADSLINDTFSPYGFPNSIISSISGHFHESPEMLLKFLMHFHYQMPQPAHSRLFVSTATIAVAYFGGGLVPLIPYFCVKRHEVLIALWWSIGIMAIALFGFGWVKTGVVSGWRGQGKAVACMKGGLLMVLAGGAAAGAAVGLVRAVDR